MALIGTAVGFGTVATKLMLQWKGRSECFLNIQGSSTAGEPMEFFRVDEEGCADPPATLRSLFVSRTRPRTLRLKTIN
jgi:hypothetical protein